MAIATFGTEEVCVCDVWCASCVFTCLEQSSAKELWLRNKVHESTHIPQSPANHNHYHHRRHQFANSNFSGEDEEKLPEKEKKEKSDATKNCIFVFSVFGFLCPRNAITKLRNNISHWNIDAIHILATHTHHTTPPDVETRFPVGIPNRQPLAMTATNQPSDHPTDDKIINDYCCYDSYDAMRWQWTTSTVKHNRNSCNQRCGISINM